MATTPLPNLADCNCLAVRQAARYITQFYDRYLAAAGLRTTQYGILARLKRRGPMSIHALAAELVVLGDIQTDRGNVHVDGSLM